MNYRYRVKGVAEKAFILRGAHFRLGATIETIILESELAFVKEHCKLEKIEDIGATIETIILESELAFVKERCKLEKIEDIGAPSQPIPTNSKPNKG